MRVLEESVIYGCWKLVRDCGTDEDSSFIGPTPGDVLMVYPPPPGINRGTLYFRTKLTHSPCAAMERLNAPRRSQPTESAPHCNPMAEGRNEVTVSSMTVLKMVRYISSSIPSCNGTLREKHLPSLHQLSSSLPVPGTKSPAYLWKETVITRLLW